MSEITRSGGPPRDALTYLILASAHFLNAFATVADDPAPPGIAATKERWQLRKTPSKPPVRLPHAVACPCVSTILSRLTIGTSLNHASSAARGGVPVSAIAILIPSPYFTNSCH